MRPALFSPARCLCRSTYTVTSRSISFNFGPAHICSSTLLVTLFTRADLPDLHFGLEHAVCVYPTCRGFKRCTFGLSFLLSTCLGNHLRKTKISIVTAHEIRMARFRMGLGQISTAVRAKSKKLSNYMKRTRSMNRIVYGSQLHISSMIDIRTPDQLSIASFRHIDVLLNSKAVRLLANRFHQRQDAVIV